MLSYIDIEAFTTANYRVTAQPNSPSQETATSNASSIAVTPRRKNLAKRMLAAAKPTQAKQNK